MLARPIETKVTAPTAAMAVVGAVLAVLTWFQDSPDMLPGLPQWLQGALALVVPAAVTFLSGYLARHTPRPDLNGSDAEVPHEPDSSTWS